MCLQFALSNAAGCALHRSTSRVIHRLECFSFFFDYCAIARALISILLRSHKTRAIYIYIYIYMFTCPAQSYQSPFMQIKVGLLGGGPASHEHTHAIVRIHVHVKLFKSRDHAQGLHAQRSGRYPHTNHNARRGITTARRASMG